jgi:hypothetical protein
MLTEFCCNLLAEFSHGTKRHQAPESSIYHMHELVSDAVVLAFKLYGILKSNYYTFWYITYNYPKSRIFSVKNNYRIIFERGIKYCQAWDLNQNLNLAP